MELRHWGKTGVGRSWWLALCCRPSLFLFHSYCVCPVWSSVAFKGGFWCVYPSWRLHWGWHAMKGYRLYQGFGLGELQLGDLVHYKARMYRGLPPPALRMYQTNTGDRCPKLELVVHTRQWFASCFIYRSRKPVSTFLKPPTSPNKRSGW